jgi:hypothetical protein
MLGDQIPHSALPFEEMGTSQLNSVMYYITMDGVTCRTYSNNEYVEAMEYAAQLDYVCNSPEMNDNVVGNNIIIKLVTQEPSMNPGGLY